MDFIDEKCPLCGKEAKKSFISINGKIFPYYECPQCGEYSIQSDDFFWLGQVIGEIKHGDRYYYNNPDDKDYKRQLTILSSQISLDNESDSKPSSIIADNDYIKMTLNSPDIPNTPEEKVNSILKYVNKNTSFFGEYVNVSPRVIFSNNLKELDSLIKELNSSGYILTKHDSEASIYDMDNGCCSSHDVSITMKGISYLKVIKDISRKQNCFIAMWFENSLDTLLKDAIKPACIEAGYKPIRIDEIHFNDDITAHIIAEIKEAYFVIADLTGYRGGVYYEAGFARGLGKEVILTCKKDYTIEVKYPEYDKQKEEKGPHFDVNHLSTLFWEDNKLTEFKENLKNRILATVGRGSYEPENIAPI